MEILLSQVGSLRQTIVGSLTHARGVPAASIPAAGRSPTLPASVHPTQFFGRHPEKWTGQDLYRQNGYIGWKRVDFNLADGDIHAAVWPNGAFVMSAAAQVILGWSAQARKAYVAAEP